MKTAAFVICLSFGRVTKSEPGCGACVFPFKLDDATYNECTWRNSNKPQLGGRAWCSTQVNESGYHISKPYGTFITCNNSCQTTRLTCSAAPPGAEKDIRKHCVETRPLTGELVAEWCETRGLDGIIQHVNCSFHSDDFIAAQDGDRFDSRIIETNKCTFDTYLIIICAVLGVYAMAATIIGVVCTCTLNRKNLEKKKKKIHRKSIRPGDRIRISGDSTNSKF